MVKNLSFKIILSLMLSYIVIYLCIYTSVFYNYKFFINKFHTYKIYEKFAGIDINKINENVLLYLQNKEPQLINNFFNKREIDHLKDVQDVFNLLRRIFNIFLILILVILIIMFFQKQNIFSFKLEILNILITSSIITISIILFLGLMIYFNFDDIFVKMHNIFFKPGTWIFEYSDNIVNLYVENFFYDIAIHIIRKILYVSMLLAIISYTTKKFIIS